MKLGTVVVLVVFATGVGLGCVGRAATMSGDEASSEETTGDLPCTPEAAETHAAMCLAQADEAACHSVPGLGCEDQASWCAWISIVPVALENDACEFGEPRGECIVSGGGSEGCASATDECNLAMSVVVVENGGSVLKSSTTTCFPPEADPTFDNVCSVAADGTLAQESPPECACLCDPAYPA